jgi:predicted murein hydrolase (TIGR00659 family)
MTPKALDIWVYLSTTPLLGLTITLVVYQAAYLIYQRANFNPLLNPVALAVATLVLLLTLTGTPYQTYFDGAQFVHFLLGPATVALAIPLYAQLGKLKSLLVPLLAALLAGALTAIVSAVGIAWLLGASRTTLISLAPKSVTTPIAMGITEKMGGLPSLTAVLVVSTGIIGAVTAKYVLDFLHLRDHSVRGFAVGVAAHGIGTARAFQVSEEAGAFAGLGMGLNGVATALLFPLLIWLFGLG